jgi:hypothetical protein
MRVCPANFPERRFIMIAGRRARKRPLIRNASVNAVITKNLSASKEAVRPNRDQRGIHQDGASAFPAQYFDSIQLSESLRYLQQLSALRAAGVLTADEFVAARGRLLGL